MCHFFNFFRKSQTQMWLNLSEAWSNDVVQPTTLVQKWSIPIVNTCFCTGLKVVNNHFQHPKWRRLKWRRLNFLQIYAQKTQICSFFFEIREKSLGSCWADWAIWGQTSKIANIGQIIREYEAFEVRFSEKKHSTSLRFTRGQKLKNESVEMRIKN